MKTLLAGAVLALAAPLWAAVIPPPSVEDSELTRCVTDALRFLDLRPDQTRKIAGPGAEEDCSAAATFDYYESGLSHRMDRRLMLQVSDGSGRGAASPTVMLGDLQDMFTFTVNQCSIEGDAMTLDYQWHAPDGWGGKDYRVTARLERDGRGLAFARLQSKEGLFGGGGTEKAECRARR